MDILALPERCSRNDRGPAMFTSGNSLRTVLGNRGFRPMYHTDAVNYCPGCGHVQWYVGRISAECAFCATALPLQGSSRFEAPATPTGWLAAASRQA